MFRRCAGDRYIYAMSWIPSNALEDNAGLLGLSDKGKTRHVDKYNERAYAAFVSCEISLSR
jgi:hypothetical protein